MNLHKKNIVFIMDIKMNKDGRFSSSRSLPYEFSIKSWKIWCDKNDAELFVLNDLLLPFEQMGLCWQRYYLFDILKANDINYDQILMVDADTIVHPNCPNVFNMTKRNFTAAQFDASFDWILRSIECYNKHLFGNIKYNFWDYFDCGFMIVNETHESLFKKIIEFYQNNRDGLLQAEKWFLGTDQTPVNLLIKQNNIPLTLLTYEYNMCDMTRKEILHDGMTFTKMGWIYQFNALPNNQDNQAQYHWMKKTYEYLYGKN